MSGEELFHYTSAEGLFGIIDKKCIWATHHRFLNDTSEGQVVADHLHKLSQEVLVKKFETEQVIKMFEKMGFSRNPQPIFTDMPDYYVACFNQHVAPKDDALNKQPDHTKDGLLSQWRGYGKFGGYCVVFDKEKILNDLVCDQNRRIREEFNVNGTADVHELIAGSCKYGSVTNEDEKLIKLLVDHVFSDALVNSYPPNEVQEQNRVAKQRMVFMLIPFYKNLGFSEENEFRIVSQFDQANPLSQAHLKTHFRLKGGVSVPYVELVALDKDKSRKHFPIKRIIVGPAKDQNRSKQGLEIFLANHKLGHVDVHKSSIPYQE